jgi:hypothetical protein
MSDVVQLFAPEGSRRSFENSIATLIRAEHHDEAEAMLSRHLEDLPSSLPAICAALPLDAVTIDGWDIFNEKIEQLSAEGQQITAVGVELSNVSDRLNLECSYYSDQCFPFSTSSRDDILRENENYGTSWAGAFEDIDYALECRGLDELNEAIVAHPLRLVRQAPSVDQSEYASVNLARWFMYVRFHQAIKRTLDSNGLARIIPMLVGQNDSGGPWLEAVYYPTRGLRS